MSSFSSGSSSQGSSPTRRRSMDIMKLMMTDYKVDMVKDDGSNFYVIFHGPKETAYEGGTWKVHVGLPADYPFRSPSIGFKNRIYHPNVDEMSGSVCLDVINQTWSPMFDLVNIFDVFLPQLLLYPNPTDPLNSEAAALLLQDAERFKEKVKEHVRKYAPSENLPESTDMKTPSKTPGDTNTMDTSPDCPNSNSGPQSRTSGCSTDISEDYDNDDLSSLSDVSEDEENFDLDI
mmetsp:Transcript_9429/g.11742  ORF Transcript_9429/g.11742 Transcript_9429/m.11742 type:complete len:233 (-) Transcript_9429:1341-2039(-)